MSLPSLSLKSKLVFILLSVALFCIVIVGFQGLRYGKKAIKSRVTEQLIGVREARRTEIQAYFDDLRDQLRVLAASPSTVGAMREFGSAFKRLNKAVLQDQQIDKLTDYYRNQFLPALKVNVDGDPLLEHYLPQRPVTRYLQYQYLAANPNKRGEKNRLTMAEDHSYYSGVHAYYHPVFNRVIESFGYYDLFLIDLESGDIVYSVFKETDFGTNLKKGIYNTSNLGRLYQQVRKTQDHGDVQLVDFDFYRPSYNLPAAFIGTTIFDEENRAVGMIAAQIDIARLNEVMTGNRQWERQGLGKTGEAFLVGQDGLMRTDARALMQEGDCYRHLTDGDNPDPVGDKICRLKSSILLQEIDNKAFRKVRDGQSGIATVTSYQGRQVLTAFAPADIDGVKWSIMAEMTTDEANRPVRDFQRELVISAVIISSLITFLAMWIANRFIAPLSRIMRAVRKLGAGDTRARVEIDRDDEYGALAKTFNSTVELINAQQATIDAKTEQNRELLRHMFPAVIAQRVEEGETCIADRIGNVAILFTSMRGFNAWSESLSPEAAVAELNALIGSFDEAADKYGVEKIKTIGDSYMAACGLTVPRLDQARRMLDFAREMLVIVRRYNHEKQTRLALRIGLHCGPVVAGLVGATRFVYDVWGDTVNIASRIRFEADPNTIMVTSDIRERLDDKDGFNQAHHVSTKGMGELEIWQWIPEWLAEEADTEIMAQPDFSDDRTASGPGAA